MEAELKSNDRKPDIKETIQTMSLIVVAVLLIFTSTGNATVMFWASLASMVGLFIWFLADRNIWLATISVMIFAITIVVTAPKLY
jgi:hypothetical protein